MSQPVVDGFNLGVDLGANDYFVRYLDEYKDAKISKRIKKRIKKKRSFCKKKKDPIEDIDIANCV